MPRYEFSQGTSDKFWEISREGTSVTVCYGRIGAKGTTKTKEHKDEAAAQKDLEKQTAGKVKKGYVLVEEGGVKEKQPLVGIEKECADFWEHPKHFAFRRIVDYDPKKGLTQAAKGVAYRVALDYDEGDEEELCNRLRSLADDKKAGELKGLVIGSCEDAFDGLGAVATTLAEIQPKLPNLEAIFLGDIISEECEASWIQQGDWGPVVSGYPKLEHFRIRGQASATTFSSPTLRALTVQSMTNAESCKAIGASDLPELEHLELWLGTDDYGGDATIDDLVPILSGSLFPKLRYLGLRNAQIADDVAEALATSPILERIRVLDLSLGVLTDRGGNALLSSPAVAKLERLDLHFNYLSDEVAKKLAKLPPQVNTSRGEAEEDDDYRFVAVGE